MRRLLSAALALAGVAAAGADASAPKVLAGRIERIGALPSRYVDPRPVDVWLPADFDGRRRYKVIYMHDGQALFDPGLSWNGVSWDVAGHVARLRAAGAIADTIVVGIWNNGAWRHAEYFPQKALAWLPEGVRGPFVQTLLKGRPQADNYLRFIVEELRPEIERRYPVRAGRENTIVMGSSMGGIISLYALCEYPDVFGAAGCLSTHWIGTFEQNASIPLATFTYLRDHLPDPRTHRIYMDHGTQGLDALYGVHQGFADVLMRERGYGEGSYKSLVFPGATHQEADWARRLDTPLVFLAGP